MVAIMREILVTDKLFVFKEHEAALKAAGFTVRRPPNWGSTAEELLRELRDPEGHIEGYILGGVERVTADIVREAPLLRAIAFTGSGYQEFIPGHEECTRRGIAIAAAKGANACAVAEYTVTLMLTMIRELPLLTVPGKASFSTTKSAEGTTVGILGFGRIGRRVAQLCGALGFSVLATPRVPTAPVDGVTFVSKETLLEQADIISIHVDKSHGHEALNAHDIESLRTGTIVINVAFPDAVDQVSLRKRLRSMEIKAAFDAPFDIDVSEIPREFLIQSNSQTAFNTISANKRTSDWVTRAMIAMLTGGDDPLLVNPEYRRYVRD